MQGVVVIDDLVPQEVQDQIEKMSMSGEFDWWYGPVSVYKDPNADQLIPSHQFQFSHNFNPNDKFYSILRPMVQAIKRHFKINHPLMRLKINMNINRRSDTTDFTDPHVDDQRPHLVALYYVNTCDGDTVIFDQKCTDQFEEFTVMKRVTPKKGRVALFHGHQYHASSTPKISDFRTVVNVTFDLREEHE
jgi:hypothetical protein